MSTYQPRTRNQMPRRQAVALLKRNRQVELALRGLRAAVLQAQADVRRGNGALIDALAKNAGV